MAVNTTRPTNAQVTAGERVLAEAHGQRMDGYWRPLAEAVIEAAEDVKLREFVAEIEAFEFATGQGRR